LNKPLKLTINPSSSRYKYIAHFSNGANTLHKSGIQMTGLKVSELYHLWSHSRTYLAGPKIDFKRKINLF